MGEGELSCHIEDLSEIPSAAHEILDKVFKRGTEDPKKLQELRLGRCRTFGRFPGSEWKEGGIESAISDIEDEDDETYDMYGEYQVMEFTLIDGANNGCASLLSSMEAIQMPTLVCGVLFIFDLACNLSLPFVRLATRRRNGTSTTTQCTHRHRNPS